MYSIGTDMMATFDYLPFLQT